MTTPLPNIQSLTVWQPWASAIAYGTKKIENRTWPTAYRGLLLIHAGLTQDRHAWNAPLARPFLRRPQPKGAIVAVARLIDCHAPDGYCTLWSAPGQWHWKLTDVTRLSEPLPWPGDRGLWTPPDGLLSAPLLAEALGVAHD
ncbi:ASCH domain-containing protein [Streptomyces sp. NBC_01381]|uniref:ASCH domain-containing protein n=1 Tax=Streptomyces sp. NBC_01381 TaxID=2903845 RepID=UPI00225744B2|nr:ASCH domain-containing protein [Streptomyces sp. NBC_01381]MCX4672847.1 ASCH domain-containing protein [Streptomyces sp. NBC_01381]